MITVEKLNNFGANTAEGLARCFGNEALYLKLVATIPGEASFGKLKDALAEKNLKAAFEAAHALKGVLANLSLTPIYTRLQKLPNCSAAIPTWITKACSIPSSKRGMNSADFARNKL